MTYLCLRPITNDIPKLKPKRREHIYEEIPEPFPEPILEPLPAEHASKFPYEGIQDHIFVDAYSEEVDV
jgi:hypothetical protein